MRYPGTKKNATNNILKEIYNNGILFWELYTIIYSRFINKL